MCRVQLCVRAGDEKALAIRGQLLLEIHYMQMRRAVAQARGEMEYDRALAKRAYLIHKRLENESDEDLRRNLAVSHPHHLVTVVIPAIHTALFSFLHHALQIFVAANSRLASMALCAATDKWLCDSGCQHSLWKKDG